MSQTSSPTLSCALIVSTNEATSGNKENLVDNFLYMDVENIASLFPNVLSEQSFFTRLLLHYLNRTSAQTSSLEKFTQYLLYERERYYRGNFSLQPFVFKSGGATNLSESYLVSEASNLPVSQMGSSSSLQTEAIQWIRAITGLPQDRIARLLGVTRQTLYNWEKGEPISEQNRQKLLTVREILERAASRNPTVDLLAAWLDTPRGAEGYTPARLIESNEFGKARLFAVSTPSPRLKRAPSWVKRSIPEKFASGEEHYDETLPPFEIQERPIETNSATDNHGEDTVVS